MSQLRSLHVAPQHNRPHLSTYIFKLSITSNPPSFEEALMSALVYACNDFKGFENWLGAVSVLHPLCEFFFSNGERGKLLYRLGRAGVGTDSAISQSWKMPLLLPKRPRTHAASLHYKQIRFPSYALWHDATLEAEAGEFFEPGLGSVSTHPIASRGQQRVS